MSAGSPEGSWSFRATVYRQGILRCVDVPDRVAAALAEWHTPPVVVTVAGHSRATTLMPSGAGGFRLFLHDELRRAGGVDIGGEVAIELRLDTEPELPMPDEVIRAAERIDRGIEALELLPPGLRREILRFVLDAKKPEIRARRIRRLTEMLAERAAKLPDDLE